MSNTENTTALTVLEKNKFELVPFSADIREIIEEEMDGLGAIPFDIVKIPAGGGLAFEIPGEKEDEPDVQKQIIGIVVDHHAVNAFWMQDVSEGGNSVPDCSSSDGKTGITAQGEVCDCATCPRNQFGSGKNGVGKACKNMHRVYILQSSNPVPVILVLPPTSIGGWKNYLGKKIVIRGKRPYQVLTKVTLKKEHSANSNSDYSVAVFTKVEDLTPAECETIKPITEAIKTITRSTAVLSNVTAETANFVELKDDEELPFN